MKKSRNSVEEMIKSPDKETRYLALSMIRSGNVPDLDQKYAKKLIKKIPVIERIKDFSDICLELEIDEAEILPFPDPISDKEKYLNACIQIPLIAKVYNEDDKFPMLGKSLKYFLYFELKDPGWRVFAGNWIGVSRSSLPAGFYFKTEQLAQEAGKKFLDIYNIWVNYKF